MQRPRDALPLSPDEGAALLERLARHTLRAEDRGVLVQVVRWLLWLVCVVQEAKLSLTWLRTVLGVEHETCENPDASCEALIHVALTV